MTIKINKHNNNTLLINNNYNKSSHLARMSLGMLSVHSSPNCIASCPGMDGPLYIPQLAYNFLHQREHRIQTVWARNSLHQKKIHMAHCYTGVHENLNHRLSTNNVA